MTRHYERTETRQHQIAEAALRVISEQGLSRFTTKAIAAEVGITDGTLFRHFQDKEAIVLAAIRVLDAQMFSEGSQKGLDPVTALEKMFRSRARFIGGEGAIGRLVFSDELSRVAGRAGQEALQKLRERNLQHLARSVRAIRSAGRLKADLSNEQLSLLIMGQLLTFGVRKSLNVRDGKRQLEHFVDLSWETLRFLLFN